MRDRIDYNNCTVLRCFKKGLEHEYVDVPIAGGTGGDTRTAILKNADALVYKRIRTAASWELTKYDYYVILRRIDGNILASETWNDKDGVVHCHAGGCRNKNSICYFDVNYKLTKTIKVIRDAQA